MRTLVLRKRDGVDLYLGYVPHDVREFTVLRSNERVC